MTTTLDPAQTVVPGIFGSYEQAEAAIAELRELGLTNCDILVVARAGPLVEQAREIIERRGGRCFMDQLEDAMEVVALPGD